MIEKDNAVLSLDKGVLNKIGVHDFRPVTIDKLTNSLKISNISYWKLSNVGFQKAEAFRSLLLGLYKKDLVMEEGKIIESLSYNLYIGRLLDFYNNNSLTKESYDSISFLLDFFIEKIGNDPIKIEAWDFLISKTLILENGEIYLPNLEVKDLPLRITNFIDDIENS